MAVQLRIARSCSQNASQHFHAAAERMRASSSVSRPTRRDSPRPRDDCVEAAGDIVIVSMIWEWIVLARVHLPANQVKSAKGASF
jgi:hypothetical protein